MILILLCFLFAAGIAASGSFVDTVWGGFVKKRLVPAHIWMVSHPLLAFPLIIAHYLLLLVLLALVAAFPGGALWLAPIFGVQVGLIAKNIFHEQTNFKPQLPFWLFTIGGLFVSLLEGITLLFCAYGATQGSLGLEIDFARSLGVMLVLGPVAVLVFSLCGLCESLLLWLNPMKWEGIT